MVLTCNETGTAELTWISDRFQQISYTSGDPEGTEIVSMGFTANLTEAVIEDSISRRTSTLMFTFTASLDGLTVECRTLVNGQIMSRMATVEITGTREHYCMCRTSILTHLCILTSTAPPSPSQSPQLSVSGYGVGGATVTVEWTYTDDGPVADNYTVSLSVGEPVTTTELMAIIEGVPYDQPLTGSVVATNCIGSGSPASLEGIAKEVASCKVIGVDNLINIKVMKFTCSTPTRFATISVLLLSSLPPSSINCISNTSQFPVEFQVLPSMALSRSSQLQRLSTGVTLVLVRLQR